MRDDPEVRQAVDTFQLGIPRLPVAGRAGDLLGRSTGSSLEFQEHREYMPGDDIRHLDWAAYARSDHLMVRLYREETSLRTQVLLDMSRSMNTGDGAKSRVARQLATALALMVGGLGGLPSITLLGDEQPPRQLLGDEIEMLSEIQPAAQTDVAQLAERQRIPLKPNSARILISDFLYPHDAANLVRSLAAGSTLFWVIQVLTRFEADPQTLGGRKLIDVESRDEADVRVTATSIQRYLGRLQRIKEFLRSEVLRLHGCWASVVVDRGLMAVCQDELCQAGILRPR